MSQSLTKNNPKNPGENDDDIATSTSSSVFSSGSDDGSNSDGDGARIIIDTAPYAPSRQVLDLHEPIRRPSVFRGESFIVQFSKTKGPPQIAFLFMLLSMGLGATIGVVPAVMTDRFARLNHGYEGAVNCNSILDSNVRPEECYLASTDAQNAVTSSNLLSNIFQFVSSSMVGSISDEYGRKRIMVLGLCIATLSPLMLVVTQLIPMMSPNWYYWVGASTGLIPWMPVALSALADVLPPEFRAPGVGLLMAGFMLGFSLSPIFSILLSHLQLSIFSFCVVFGVVWCTIFLVPETLPPHVAAEARRRRKNRLNDQGGDDKTNVQKICWILLRPVRELSILNRNKFFRLVSLLAFFTGIVTSGDQILLVYYVEDQFGFTDKDISKMFLIMGPMGLFTMAVLLKAFNDCFGEKMVIAISFMVGTVSNVMYGIAPNKAMIFTAVGIGALANMAFPTISAIKSNNVDESEQGQIQGALYSLQALASGLGPVILLYINSKLRDTFLGPGAMFIVAGGLYLIAVSIACALPKEMANSRKIQNNSPLYMDLSESVDESEDNMMESIPNESNYGSV